MKKNSEDQANEYEKKYLELKNNDMILSSSKDLLIKLKSEVPNCEQIHENYDYPISSFLSDDGYWTYTDADSININGDDNTTPIESSNDTTNYEPIQPKILLDIDLWDKIYFYQEGSNDYEEWI